jgi:hypothetical protein
MRFRHLVDNFGEYRGSLLTYRVILCYHDQTLRNRRLNAFARKWLLCSRGNEKEGTLEYKK